MLLSFRSVDDDLAVTNVTPDCGTHLAILDVTRVHVVLAELFVLDNTVSTHLVSPFRLYEVYQMARGDGNIDVEGTYGAGRQKGPPKGPFRTKLPGRNP